MDNLEKSLNEELKRFNQIGYNSTNLEEQMLGSVGGGSGFMAKQGESNRLKKFESRQLEMSEQEDPEAPTEEEEMTSFADMGVGDEDVEVDIESEMGAPDAVTPLPVDAAAPVAPVDPEVPVAEPVTVPETPEETEDTTEIEVGDLIDKQETLEKNTEETNTKLDSLMSMLDGMEQKLAGMDQLMTQISSLEEKIENQRPKSEQEKLENRKMDSGPYDQTLSDFWDDSQDKFETQGKEEYILTPDDVENFSDADMKKSFY